MIYYSSKQFAELLGISKQHLLNKEREGVLPKAKRIKKGSVQHRYYTDEDLPVYRKLLGLPPIIDVKRTLMVQSYKGGAGKSTVAANIVFYLAQRGLKCLAVDLDPQGNLTWGLGKDPDHCPVTLYNVLVEGLDIEEAILHTHLTGLDLIPANVYLTPIDMFLFNSNYREFKLKRELSKVQTHYDIILLDCNATASPLQVNAALCATDILIPVSSEIAGFTAIKLLLDSLHRIQQDMPIELHWRIHIFLNKYNPQIRTHRVTLEELKTTYYPYLKQTIIRQDQNLANAYLNKRTIFEYDPNSPAAEDIRKLVQEIIPFH